MSDAQEIDFQQFLDGRRPDLESSLKRERNYGDSLLNPQTRSLLFRGKVNCHRNSDLGMGIAGAAQLAWNLGSFNRDTAQAARGQLYDIGRRTINGEFPQSAFGALAGATDQLVVYDNPLSAIRIGTSVLAGGAVGRELR